jgi:leucyl-tRNA synthetase
VDKTVLANEQVDANGCSWRSGAKVEKRRLKQWFLKISEFRDDLLKDLDFLAKGGAWPERVLAMQKNWLGKSIGARIKFPVVAYDQSTHSDIEVFTTRPDTLFGVQYVALASTHPIVQALAKTDPELQAFLDTIPTLPADSKVGYLLPHVRAMNPLAYDESTPAAAKDELPIYVAPYVLGDYGDGAVMGVPGHDTRDHAFWKNNRFDEPIRMVIAPSADGSIIPISDGPFIHHGHLTSHCGTYAGLTTAQATKKIIEVLESKKMGSTAETWRLRDWLVSRQRYWGTPIPIIHCNSCGPVPVPEDQLPVELPTVEGHWMKGKAGNPLDDAHDWVNTSCPKCHGPAKRDTDTMDTFVDSSWYYMRYIDVKNENMLFNPKKADDSLPVDIYIGGVEHAILHLLYARFISKFIARTGLWNSKNFGEPFKKVLTQGMVHGKTYSDPSNGRFLKPDEVDLSVSSKPIVVATGEQANVSFEKMSKSKYNGVDPSECMSKYGADVTRAHILFQAPVNEVLEWHEEKISGITRWLRRVHEHIASLQDVWIGLNEITPKAYFIEFGQAAEGGQEMLKYTESLAREFENRPGPKDISKEGILDGLSDLKFRIQLLERDKALWRLVQTTIQNVTRSYSETYSLNTVVSDLMTLTNAIIEHGDLTRNHKGPDRVNAEISSTFEINNGNSDISSTLQVNKWATKALIQMMAPITPAFSEECWELLQHSDRKGQASSPSKEGLSPAEPESWQHSVFDSEFPEMDGTIEWFPPTTQPCAVQVNGKLKAVVELPIPEKGLGGEELNKWLTGELLATDEGKKLEQKLHITEAKKVIVVHGGKTINFVIKK